MVYSLLRIITEKSIIIITPVVLPALIRESLKSPMLISL